MNRLHDYRGNMRRIRCDWDGLDAEDTRYLEPFRTRTTGIAPFHLISMTTSRSDELEAGRRDAKMYTVVSRCPSL